MPYFTYNIATRTIAGIHTTQAKANAAAAGVAGVTAHVGKVVANSAASRRGWHLYEDGSTVSRVAPPVLPTLDDLKAAVGGTVRGFRQWNIELESIDFDVPDTERKKGKAFLRQAMRGLYMIVNNSSYDISLRITICRHLAYGALDITSPAEFYVVSRRLTAPTSPKVWVQLSDGARVNLANSVPVTGTAPATTKVLAGGEWAALIAQ